MGSPRIELKEIKEKLKDPSTTVAEIAAGFGITRQALYERMRRAGINIGDRRKAKPYEKRFPRKLLIDLYEGERLPIIKVAARLQTTPERIRRELREHGIRRRGPSEFLMKHPPFSGMEIGDSFELPLPGGKWKAFSSLYVQAKREGIRIVIRRKDANTMVVTRTPELTSAAVNEMRANGMSLKAIAKVFCSTPRTILTHARRHEKRRQQKAAAYQEEKVKTRN